MTRLLFFPTPLINAAAPPTGAPLLLAATIHLDHPLHDLQGCDFISSTSLVCASNDPSADLWPAPRQLLEIDLSSPLDGRSVTGHVSFLGPCLRSACAMGHSRRRGWTFDPTAGTLRVEMIPPKPCNVLTEVYSFRR